EARPDLLFYAAEDGTSATIAGKSRLIEPSFDMSKRLYDEDKLEVADVRALEAETVDALLAEGRGPRPSVLLSVSHGLGEARRGWSEDEQRRFQGAMVIGDDQILDAEAMRAQPFLPGGMWFFLACFGVGTPAKSVYYPWLQVLAEHRAFGGSPQDVLQHLPN